VKLFDAVIIQVPGKDTGKSIKDGPFTFVDLQTFYLC
jgi:hypothetical protein